MARLFVEQTRYADDTFTYDVLLDTTCGQCRPRVVFSGPQRECITRMADLASRPFAELLKLPSYARVKYAATCEYSEVFSLAI